MSNYSVFNNQADALNYVGLGYDALKLVKAVGVIERVPTLEHPKRKNGWILSFFDGGFLAGNWETGATALFSTKGANHHQSKNKPILLCKLAEISRLEVAIRHAEKAREASNFWRACKPVILNPLHPYLKRKRVKPVSTIRETTLTELSKSFDDDDISMITGRRILVIPLISQKCIASLQFINESGQKFFLKGGQAGGGYWQSSREEKPKVIAIAEGVATVLSVIQHSNELTLGVSAMNAGNLPKVAIAIHAKYPDAQINIYGDSDPSGVGQARAKEAQESIGGNTGLYLPEFSETEITTFKTITKGEKAPTDWNDYFLIKEFSNE